MLSVRDECFEVMEGERSSLVKENYINILKEVSEIGLKPVEESTGGGLIETGCHGAAGNRWMCPKLREVTSCIRVVGFVYGSQYLTILSANCGSDTCRTRGEEKHCWEATESPALDTCVRVDA